MLKNNNVTYFYSLGVEHIPKKKIKKFRGNKNIITSIYRIQIQVDDVWMLLYCIC